MSDDMNVRQRGVVLVNVCLLHSVQREGPGRAAAPPSPPPRCTKCNSPPINSYGTNCILFDVTLQLHVPIKGLHFGTNWAKIQITVKLLYWPDQCTCTACSRGEVCWAHTLAYRHSCSTSAETRARKCFGMQLMFVIGKMDMINQICQMLSFCWKLLSAYFAQKVLLSTLLRTVVTAKSACNRNTDLCFFPMYACKSRSLTLYPTSKFWVMKTASLSHNFNRMRYNIKGRWQPGHQCESFHWSIIYNVAEPDTIHFMTVGKQLSKLFLQVLQVYRRRYVYDKAPLAARCCHLANDFTNFTDRRQTTERTDS